MEEIQVVLSQPKRGHIRLTNSVVYAPLLQISAELKNMGGTLCVGHMWCNSFKGKIYW
jgi:hypothetical protein